MAVRDVVMAAAGVSTGAAITFVASASNHTPAASIAINKPTGTVEGDLMIAVLNGTQGASDANFASTGWAILYAFDNGTDSSQAVLYKVAGASEGSSYTFTNGGNIVGSIVTYRNASMGLYSQYVANTAGSTITLSGLTIPTSGCLLFAFCGDKDATPFSTPSGMTSVVSNTSNGGYALFSEPRDAGATGTRASTATGGAGSATISGFTFFITPSSFYQPGPFFISQSTVQETSSSLSLDLNKPAGTREGDLMIAYLLSGGGNQSNPGWFDPAGWTYAVNLTGGASTNRPFNAIAYKVAGASEPSTYTFQATTSRTLAGTIVTYRNGAYDATGTQVSAADPLVLPAVTATENYSRVVGIAGRDVSNYTVIGPSGMSNLVTQNDATTPSWVIEQGNELIADISTGTRSFTVGNTSNVNGLLHTIKPAASYTKYANYISAVGGSGNAGAGGGATAQVNTPNTVPGNLLICFVSGSSNANSGTPTVTLPTGFTELASSVSTGAFNVAAKVGWRVVDGTEGATISATGATLQTKGGLLLSVVVVAGGTNPSVGAVATGTGTTSVSANGITATANGLLLFLGAIDNGTVSGVTFTPPSGYTEALDLAYNNAPDSASGQTVAYKEGNSAGSTGTVTATASVSGNAKGFLVNIEAK